MRKLFAFLSVFPTLKDLMWVVLNSVNLWLLLFADSQPLAV